MDVKKNSVTTKLTGLFTRNLDFLLGTQKPMRIRTSQFLLAALLMLACVGIVYFMRAVGISGMGNIDLWAAVSIGGLVLIYTLIRSGLSSRLADPSLAFIQMLYAIACDAAAFTITGQGRGVALPILSVILMFGMFGLSIRQVMIVAGYGLTLFSFSVAYLHWYLHLDEPTGLLIAYFLILFVVLMATTVLTWRLQRISAYIREQKNQLALAFDKIQQISNYDELTGLANRRYMLEKMRNEVQRAERTSAPLLLAILDIDHFKQINDQYGHLEGDRALQLFTSVVQNNIRTNDTLARWGGEEFLILLTDTEASVGAICLERVRTKVAEEKISVHNSALNLTVSIGVTAFTKGETIETTLARADAALYRAKGQGRNQTVWHNSDLNSDLNSGLPPAPLNGA